MKKIVLSLGVIFLFVLGASAQENSSGKAENPKKAQMQQNVDQQSQTNNPNAPVIEFNKTVHDYGDIKQNGNGKCEFQFTNKGKEPLILSNVRSSCGCTVPEWPRAPILPGQSETIKVKYDTKRVGPINKTIHVYSNASESPITLRIKGTVHAASESAMPEKKMDKEAAPINK